MMFSQFFGFAGRVGRGTWWIGQLVLLVAYAILNFFLGAKTEEWKALLKSARPNSAEALALLASMGNWLVILFVYLVFSTWLALSTGVQRLHDRNSSGWRMLFAYAPLMMIFASVYVLLVQQAWASFTLMLIMTCISFVVTWVWQLVELGCLSGDDYENEYGEAPGASRRRSALEQELAALRGEDNPRPAPEYQAAPVTARLATPSGPVAFGKR
jgi:uncharacterized membrane protein YhaH (DUF805 family)